MENIAKRLNACISVRLFLQCCHNMRSTKVLYSQTIKTALCKEFAPYRGLFMLFLKRN